MPGPPPLKISWLQVGVFSDPLPISTFWPLNPRALHSPGLEHVLSVVLAHLAVWTAEHPDGNNSLCPNFQPQGRSSRLAESVCDTCVFTNQSHRLIIIEVLSQVAEIIQESEMQSLAVLGFSAEVLGGGDVVCPQTIVSEF